MQERLIQFHPATFEPMLGKATLDALLHRRHEHVEGLIKGGRRAAGAPLKGRLARALGEGMEPAASHRAYGIHCTATLSIE
jgi:hypothetical protein